MSSLQCSGAKIAHDASASAPLSKVYQYHTGHRRIADDSTRYASPPAVLCAMRHPSNRELLQAQSSGELVMDRQVMITDATPATRRENLLPALPAARALSQSWQAGDKPCCAAHQSLADSWSGRSSRSPSPAGVGTFCPATVLPPTFSEPLPAGLCRERRVGRHVSSSLPPWSQGYCLRSRLAGSRRAVTQPAIKAVARQSLTFTLRNTI